MKPIGQWSFGEFDEQSHFYYVGRHENQQLGSAGVGADRVESELIHTFTTYSEHNYYTSRLAGLRFLFPSLWPEAEADAELARGEAANR